MSNTGTQNVVDGIAPLGHALSTTGILLSWLGYLSPILASIATVFSIIWFGIAIYESRTFHNWNRDRLMKNKAKKIARLKAREKVIVAELEALELVRSAKVEAREKISTAKAEASQLVAHEDTEAEIRPIKPL